MRFYYVHLVFTNGHSINTNYFINTCFFANDLDASTLTERMDRWGRSRGLKKYDDVFSCQRSVARYNCFVRRYKSRELYYSVGRCESSSNERAEPGQSLVAQPIQSTLTTFPISRLGNR